MPPYPSAVVAMCHLNEQRVSQTAKKYRYCKFVLLLAIAVNALEFVAYQTIWASRWKFWTKPYGLRSAIFIQYTGHARASAVSLEGFPQQRYLESFSVKVGQTCAKSNPVLPLYMFPSALYMFPSGMFLIICCCHPQHNTKGSAWMHDEPSHTTLKMKLDKPHRNPKWSVQNVFEVSGGGVAIPALHSLVYLHVFLGHQIDLEPQWQPKSST